MSVSTTEEKKCRVIPVMKDKEFVNKLYYFKRTNFRVSIFSRISRILVNFTKLNTREIFF